MLKGTTKIELTDIHTGKKEVREETNMITNALRDIFRPLGLSQKPSRYFSDFVPYYATVLGGLLCFDTTIEENADNYFPPATANLIGCAAYGEQNNTTNTFRGGYNQTESEVNLTNRYMKYVYDFATSQANGTINCVCLTHKNGGFTSYGSKNAVYTTSYPLVQSICEDTLQYVYPDRTGGKTSSRYSGYTVGTTELIFLIDRENDCVYYFKVVDKTHISIVRRKAYLKSVSVLENVYSKKALIDETELDELTTELYTSYLGYNYDPATDKLYICSAASSTTKAGATLLVTEVALDTWKVTQYEVTNTADKTMNTNGMWAFFVTDGFLYLRANDSPYDLYKFEVANPANVVKFTRTNVSSVQGVAKMAINGRIYYDTLDDQLLIANTSSNEILKPECQSFFNNYRYQANVTPVRNEPLFYFADFGTYSTLGWYMMCNYLATINNLSEPVTKTADKTMKITYILQED